MSEPSKILKLCPDPPDDGRMVVQLSVSELRQMIGEEVKKSLRGATTPDEWVDIDKAAAVLSVSPDWIYHNVKRLPFARKIGPRQLRFSVHGMQKWMEVAGR